MNLEEEQKQKRLDFKGGLFSPVKCGRSSTEEQTFSGKNNKITSLRLVALDDD